MHVPLQVKTQLQLDSKGAKRFSGSMDVVRQTIKVRCASLANAGLLTRRRLCG
jgi:hypothetical protein